MAPTAPVTPVVDVLTRCSHKPNPFSFNVPFLIGLKAKLLNAIAHLQTELDGRKHVCLFNICFDLLISHCS